MKLLKKSEYTLRKQQGRSKQRKVGQGAIAAKSEETAAAQTDVIGGGGPLVFHVAQKGSRQCLRQKER